MSSVITEVEIVPITCGGCGVVFGLNRWHKEKMRREGGEFYCPNGCRRVYRETEADRLQKQLKKARDALISSEACNDQLIAELQAQERKTRAEKAAKTRIKNRIANGVCPCCKRHFKNLHAHMKNQHPDYVSKDDEARTTDETNQS